MFRVYHCLFVTKVTVISVSVIVESFVVFDVVRNQYFYFTEDLVSFVSHAVLLFIMIQVAAEVATEGLEAIVFTMMMANWTCSYSFAVILGNLVSLPFQVIG